MSYMDDDQGGNTAQFQAFAHRHDEGAPTQAWEMNASRSRSRAWIVGIVVAVAAVAAVAAILIAG